MISVSFRSEKVPYSGDSNPAAAHFLIALREAEYGRQHDSAYGDWALFVLAPYTYSCVWTLHINKEFSSHLSSVGNKVNNFTGSGERNREIQLV